MVRVVSWLSALLYIILLTAMGAGAGSAGRKGGMFPSARVGRSDSTMNCCRETSYYKRHQGLIPFPRVGRSGRVWRAADPDDRLWQLLGPHGFIPKSDSSNEYTTDKETEVLTRILAPHKDTASQSDQTEDNTRDVSDVGSIDPAPQLASW